ncbi:hypothetical protein ACYPKM_04310 [Pseudomonas aeruginosa]
MHSAKQPAPHDDEVLVSEGVWTVAGLQRLKGMQGEIQWTVGPLGQVGSIAGTVIASITRRRKDNPWGIRLEGFQWWSEPNALYTKHHYSPVAAAGDMRAAKALVKALFAARPNQ